MGSWAKVGKTNNVKSSPGVSLNLSSQASLSVCKLSLHYPRKNSLSDDFGPGPSQNLESIYLPAMLQWPKDSCYVANTLLLQYEWDFRPKNTNIVYFWPGKKSFQNAKKFLSSLLGVKTLLFLHLMDENKNPNWTCSSRLPRQEMVFWKLFPPQNGRFCFTGNSQLHHLYRQLLCHSRLCLLVTKPKPTNQNAHWKVLTQQPKQENECLPPYFDH